MRTAELVMAVVLGVFSLYLMSKSAELPIGWIPGEGPGGGAWPFWLAVGMLFCCIATVYRWEKRITPESQSEEVYMDKCRAPDRLDRGLRWRSFWDHLPKHRCANR